MLLFIMVFVNAAQHRWEHKYLKWRYEMIQKTQVEKAVEIPQQTKELQQLAKERVEEAQPVEVGSLEALKKLAVNPNNKNMKTNGHSSKGKKKTPPRQS